MTRVAVDSGMAAGAGERPLFGAALIVAGMLSIGAIDNCVRIIAEHVGLWQFHFVRTCLAAPGIVALAYLFGWRLRPRSWRAAGIRTFFIVLSMLIYFGSLPLAPITQVAAGMLTSPLWVLAISALVFGAPIGPRRVIAVAVGFIGALVILAPWEDAFTLWSAAPLGAGLAYALAALATRRLCADEPPMGLILLFFLGLGLAGGIGTLTTTAFADPDATVFALRPWVWAIPAEAWFWIAVQAFGSIFCVFCVTRGYQSADPATISLYDYTFLISAGLTAWIAWGETPGPGLALGAALIVGSGAFIALREARGR